MKNAVIVILSAIILGLLGTAVYLNSKFDLTSYMKAPTGVVNLESDTHYVVETQTIKEVLEFRRDVKEDMKVDSIYLNMSDIALTGILLKLGTTASHRTIVKEYLDNINYYNSLNLGANISKEVQKKAPQQPSIVPDSLPITEIPKID